MTLLRLTVQMGSLKQGAPANCYPVATAPGSDRLAFRLKDELRLRDDGNQFAFFGE